MRVCAVSVRAQVQRPGNGRNVISDWDILARLEFTPKFSLGLPSSWALTDVTWVPSRNA